MKNILIISLLFMSSVAYGTDDSTKIKKPIAIYAQIMGNSFIHGIHIEKTFLYVGNYAFATNIGYGFSHSEFGIFNETVIPIEFTAYNQILKKHHLEFGLGVSYYQYAKSKRLFSYEFVDSNGTTHYYQGPTEVAIINNYLFFSRIGYRYTTKSGFMYRVALTPFYSQQFSPKFNFSAGISIGYVFN